MEWELVNLAKRFTRREDEDAVPLGDIVINVDAFDSSIHWYPFLDPYYVGRRAALASISDVLVKGARPLWLLTAVRIPARYDRNIYFKFLEGIASLCAEINCELVGGDTDISQRGGFRATVVTVGKAIRFISRSGAKPGELVVSTGNFGVSWVVYKSSIEGKICGGEAFSLYLHQSLPSVDAWLDVIPYVSASIDNSDGLSLSLHYIAERSNVGILVENVPVWEKMEECGGGIKEALYYSGEEYQFIFTLPEDKLNYVKNKLGKIYVIGRVVETPGVRFRDGRPVYKRGWVGGLKW